MSRNGGYRKKTGGIGSGGHGGGASAQDPASSGPGADAYIKQRVVPDLIHYPTIGIQGVTDPFGESNYSAILLPLAITPGTGSISKLHRDVGYTKAVQTSLLLYDFLLRAVGNDSPPSMEPFTDENDPRLVRLPDHKYKTKEVIKPRAPKPKKKKAKKANPNRGMANYMNDEADEDDDEVGAYADFGDDGGMPPPPDAPPPKEYHYYGNYFYDDNGHVRLRFTVYYEILLKDGSLPQETRDRINEAVAELIDLDVLRNTESNLNVVRPLAMLADPIAATPMDKCLLDLSSKFTRDSIAGLLVHFVGMDPKWSISARCSEQISRNNQFIAELQNAKANHLSNSATHKGQIKDAQEKMLMSAVEAVRDLEIPDSRPVISGIPELIRIMNEYRVALLSDTLGEGAAPLDGFSELLIDSATAAFPKRKNDFGQRVHLHRDVDIPDMKKYPLSHNELRAIMIRRDVNAAQLLPRVHVSPANHGGVHPEHTFYAPLPPLMYTTRFEETRLGPYCSFPHWLGLNCLPAMDCATTYSALYNLRNIDQTILYKLNNAPDLRTDEGVPVTNLQAHEILALENRWLPAFWETGEINTGPAAQEKLRLKMMEIVNRLISLTKSGDMGVVSSSIKAVISVLEKAQADGSSLFIADSPLFEDQDPAANSLYARLFRVRETDMFSTQIELIRYMFFAMSLFNVNLVHADDRDGGVLHWNLITLGLNGVGKSNLSKKMCRSMPEGGAQDELSHSEQAMIYRSQNKDFQVVTTQEAPVGLMKGEDDANSNKKNQTKTILTENTVSSSRATPVEGLGIVTLNTTSSIRIGLFFNSNSSLSYNTAQNDPLLARFEIEVLSFGLMQPQSLKATRPETDMLVQAMTDASMRMLRQEHTLAIYIIMLRVIRIVPRADTAIVKYVSDMLAKNNQVSVYKGMDHRCLMRHFTFYATAHANYIACFLMHSPQSPWCVVVRPEDMDAEGKVPARQGYEIEYSTGRGPKKPVYYKRRFDMTETIPHAIYLGTPSLALAVFTLATRMKNVITFKSGVEMALKKVGLDFNQMRLHVRAVDQQRVAYAALNQHAYDCLTEEGRFKERAVPYYERPLHEADGFGENLYYAGFHHLPAHFTSGCEKYPQVAKYPLLRPKITRVLKRMEDLDNMRRAPDAPSQNTNTVFNFEEDNARHEARAELKNNAIRNLESEGVPLHHNDVFFHPMQRAPTRVDKINRDMQDVHHFYRTTEADDPAQRHPYFVPPIMKSESAYPERAENLHVGQMPQLHKNTSLGYKKLDRQTVLPFLYMGGPGKMWIDPNWMVLTMPESQFAHAEFTKLVASVIRDANKKTTTDGSCNDASYLVQMAKEVSMEVPVFPLLEPECHPDSAQRIGALFHPDFVKKLPRRHRPLIRVIKMADEPIYSKEDSALFNDFPVKPPSFKDAARSYVEEDHRPIVSQDERSEFEDDEEDEYVDENELYVSSQLEARNAAAAAVYNMKGKEKAYSSRFPRRASPPPPPYMQDDEDETEGLTVITDGIYIDGEGTEFDYNQRVLTAASTSMNASTLKKKADLAAAAKRIPLPITSHFKKAAKAPPTTKAQKAAAGTVDYTSYSLDISDQKKVVYVLINTAFMMLSPEGIMWNAFNKALPAETLYRPNVPLPIPDPLNPTLFLSIPIGHRKNNVPPVVSGVSGVSGADGRVNGGNMQNRDNGRDAPIGARDDGNVRFADHVDEDSVNTDLAGLRMRSLMAHGNQKVAEMAHRKPTLTANLEIDLEFHYGDGYNRKIGVDHRQNIPYVMARDQTSFAEAFEGHPEVRHSALPGILIREQME